MLKHYVIAFIFFTNYLSCVGQAFTHTKGESFLYFKKNSHREAMYSVSDVISFDLKNNKEKVSDQIKGFEDSLIVFQSYKLNYREISALYVDKKTKIWFILRYKYEKLFFLTGADFLPIDIINTGRIEPKALAVSGALLGAGLLSRWLISDKIKIRGKRKLLIISYYSYFYSMGCCCSVASLPSKTWWRRMRRLSPTFAAQPAANNHVPLPAARVAGLHLAARAA